MGTEIEVRESLVTISERCDALFDILDNATNERYAESVEELEVRHDILTSAVRDLVCLLHDTVRAIDVTHPNTGRV